MIIENKYWDLEVEIIDKKNTFNNYRPTITKIECGSIQSEYLLKNSSIIIIYHEQISWMLSIIEMNVS